MNSYQLEKDRHSFLCFIGPETVCGRGGAMRTASVACSIVDRRLPWQVTGSACGSQPSPQERVYAVSKNQ